MTTATFWHLKKANRYKIFIRKKTNTLPDQGRVF